MTMKTIKRDISITELKKFNKALSKQYITYGVHKDKGVKQRGGTNEASIAYYLEFGTGMIPARPAIRTFIVSKNSRKALLDEECVEMQRAIKRKSPRQFWNSIRGFVQQHVKARILGGLTPSNRPSTIKRKGFDLPWVDTGQLVFEDMEARVNK